MEPTGQIILYQAKDGTIALDVQLQDETLWLSQKQMADLFGKDVRTINEHVKTIYQEGELEQGPTIRKFRIVQQEGGRTVTRTVDGYNLDMIISVGYRVNSKEGTRFRIWATQVLRDHLVQGFTVNRSNYKDRLNEFEQAVALIKRTVNSKLLDATEATGLLDVITDYAHTWTWLQKYDDDTLSEPVKKAQPEYLLTYEEAIAAIVQLKSDLIQKGLASDLFGAERNGYFEGIIGTLYQTFGGEELYPTIEAKAAHLLYFVIKDHPFSDGNKRIGSLLFVIFLARNHYLAGPNGERKFNDNALVALALLTAESDPRHKDTLIRLIMNFVASPKL